MALQRHKFFIGSSCLLLAAAAGYLVYAIARQGEGTRELAQAPLNVEVQIPPAFIMAVDDSGSMTFHNQLPAADGYGCWQDTGNASTSSFFQSSGVLRTTGSNCNYSYAYTGPRISTGHLGIPPVDNYGFARSSDFNPAYFNPAVKYEPWLNSDGTPYGSSAANPQGNASPTATRIDPRQTATIALAAQLEDANDRSRFQAHRNMFLPAGTRYRLVGNNDCGGLTGGGSWRLVGANGHTMSGSCALYVGFWPATFYQRWTSATDPMPVLADSPNAYDNVPRQRIDNACGANCHLWRYRIRPEDTAALQNFANWFSFYGNRNRAMVAGMTRAMDDVTNMRVGYFTINNRVAVTMRDMAIPADRTGLYSSMFSLPANGGTPNLTAVNHMGNQFKRTGEGAPVQLACQKNGGMLFTDGFSNVAQSAPAVTGLGAPFDPTPVDSMAAVASQFYFDTGAGASPLRADLPAGLVPVPEECSTLDSGSIEWKRLDCQKNLHMNFYGVTLGGRGDIFNPDIEQDAYLLNPAWPGYNANSRSTVDDIWHATVNTRGEFISAKTPVDIAAAMRRILQAVGEGRSPSGSIALTGSRIGTGSLTVTPFYEATNNSTDWYSTLTAQTVTSNPVTGEVSFQTKWEAADKMPAYGVRNILVAKPAASGVVPSVAAFNTSGVTMADLCSNSKARCSAASIASLGVDLTQSIAYLRGDQSLEATGNEVTLRKRTRVLGDIVNSTPVVTSPTDDWGYESLRGTTSGTFNPYNYDAYLATKKSRKPMVYAAANDGMLHAFDGDTGVEQFAYIPSTALGHMGNLLFPYKSEDKNDQVFQHRYYVDGPITVSDAYWGGSWKTALVGTAGAGGRSVFALNVSIPGSFGSGNVLWELSDQVNVATVRDNIGHVLGKPIVVPIKVGSTVSWKAIFGNGYGSANGRAALFVVDMATGAATVVTGIENDALLPSKNGLGNIVVLDRYVGSTVDKGSDGYADTVYGADQNGAIWKFDLRSATPANQTTPFFIAEDAAGGRQAITGGMTAARAPGAGVMLYFGTGSFSFVEDNIDKTMQTLYGIIDRENGSTIAGRDDLHQQRVVSDADGDRIITTSLSTPGKLGWYLDLGVSGQSGNPVATGERSVGNPVIQNGVVFFPTYEPTTAVGCTTGGANRLYGLSAFNGGASLASVRIGSPTGAKSGEGTGALALDTKGSAPVKDVGVMSTPRISPLGPNPTPAEQAAALAAQCSMVIQVSGAPSLYMPRPCGRQSWRQVR
ncbi:pilus assembly protein [Pseudoxanthomonas wuyuanensis]